MQRQAEKRIVTRQIRLIHVLTSALRMSDTDYRTTLLHNFGVSTSKALTFREAEGFIEALQHRAVEKDVWQQLEGKKKWQAMGDRPGMASPGQLRKIEALWADASRIKNPRRREKALRNFISGHFRIADLRFLPEAKVAKVIFALEHMGEQAKREARGGANESKAIPRGRVVRNRQNLKNLTWSGR